MEMCNFLLLGAGIIILILALVVYFLLSFINEIYAEFLESQDKLLRVLGIDANGKAIKNGKENKEGINRNSRSLR